MPTRTCSKCKTVTDNFSKTDRYCRDCRSAINKSKQQPVKSKGIIKLCSKCNNPVGDDKHSYCKSCKSIYDRERYKKTSTGVKLCSKCKEQINDKQSYCKSCRSIYDSERYEKSKIIEPIPQETRDLILKKVIEMNRFRV